MYWCGDVNHSIYRDRNIGSWPIIYITPGSHKNKTRSSQAILVTLPFILQNRDHASQICVSFLLFRAHLLALESNLCSQLEHLRPNASLWSFIRLQVLIYQDVDSGIFLFNVFWTHSLAITFVVFVMLSWFMWNSCILLFHKHYSNLLKLSIYPHVICIACGTSSWNLL